MCCGTKVIILSTNDPPNIEALVVDEMTDYELPSNIKYTPNWFKAKLVVTRGSGYYLFIYDPERLESEVFKFKKSVFKTKSKFLGISRKIKKCCKLDCVRVGFSTDLPFYLVLPGLQFSASDAISLIRQWII